LNALNHEIHLKTVTDVFILRSPNKMNTLITLPKRYELDQSTGKLSWAPNVLRQLTKQTAQFIICSAEDIDGNVWELDAAVSVEAAADTAVVDDALPTNPHVPKRHVGLELMHNRLGHRSHDAILLANQHNIWNDVTVTRDPESICETCRITLSRRANQSHNRPQDYPTRPGRMVMADIISNPFAKGLTPKSHFPYYLLVVDVVSHLPVFLGLRKIDSIMVFRALQRYRTNFQPSIDQDNNPEMNISPFCHVCADVGTQFSSRTFRSICDAANMKVTLAAPKHQEMNGLCERTWQSLHQLAFSFMNYCRFSEEFGDMAFEHAWKVFSVLPLKLLSNEDTLITPYEKHY
jgi:hypothetical protein